MLPSRILVCLLGLALSSRTLADVATGSWIPAGLPPPPAEGPWLTPGAYLSPDQGRTVLEEALRRFPDRATWEAYATHVRRRIQQGAGLDPWPRRTPLRADFRDRREHDGYTVENVSFESIPGYFVTGNLYRPARPGKTHPVMLSTHGHSRAVGRREDYDQHARFNPGMQARCGTLARLGVVVLSVDMFAYGESMALVGQDAHKQPVALTLQVWNAIRAIDLLLSLDGADPTRVGVSGESGGGTQSFLLAALDPRVTLSAPVVMVSSYFFGGCACESGRPIHRSADHFANNALIAALTAPRPQLVVSDGKDWTQHVPQVEFPFLRSIYGHYGAAAKVANVHLADEGHDYGPSKRAALYRFVAKQFGLPLDPALGAGGQVDESRVTIEGSTRLRVFTAENPIPFNALHDGASIERRLRELQP